MSSPKISLQYYGIVDEICLIIVELWDVPGRLQIMSIGAQPGFFPMQNEHMPPGRYNMVLVHA